MLSATGAWNYLSGDEMRLVSFIVESSVQKETGTDVTPKNGRNRPLRAGLSSPTMGLPAAGQRFGGRAFFLKKSKR